MKYGFADHVRTVLKHGTKRDLLVNVLVLQLCLLVENV